MPCWQVGLKFPQIKYLLSLPLVPTKWLLLIWFLYENMQFPRRLIIYQGFCQECIGAINHLVEPCLFADEPVRGAGNDGETGREAELFHALTKGDGMGARVIVFSGD